MQAFKELMKSAVTNVFYFMFKPILAFESWPSSNFLNH